MMQLFLKLENVAILIAVLVLYVSLGFSWQLFIVLILAPDLSFIAYFLGPKVGSWCYNAVHTWIFPAIVGAAGILAGWDWCLPVALIFAAHIAFDRMLGYGLKHESGFQDTHLGRIGKSG